MDKEARIRFVKEALESLEERILEKVDSMPEEWDGWELRQYISDKASELVWTSMKSDKKKKREYNNTVMVNNL
jgi:hypothetical protein